MLSIKIETKDFATLSLQAYRVENPSFILAQIELPQHTSFKVGSQGKPENKKNMRSGVKRSNKDGLTSFETIHGVHGLFALHCNDEDGEGEDGECEGSSDAHVAPMD